MPLWTAEGPDDESHGAELGTGLHGGHLDERQEMVGPNGSKLDVPDPGITHRCGLGDVGHAEGERGNRSTLEVGHHHRGPAVALL